jgi:predicted AlkP superfamily phosphohydrolase/phosphomutase
MADAQHRLLLIGLDAADAVLVERWAADGTLPHLATLMREGTWGRLETSAKYLTGSPWPTFYTGRPPSYHGIYHDFQWRQEQMQFAAPSSEWLPVRPFWRALGADVPVVVHDVPFTPGTEPFAGVEVTGWGSHDKLVPPESYPAEVIADIRRRWGDAPMGPDEFGRASLSRLRAMHDELTELTRRSAEVAGWLLAERPWRLGIVAFGALHRGGHRFWDRSGVDGPVPPTDQPWHDGALRELYRTADAAVGRLVAQSPGATVFVFALHGMMENAARVDFLDAMLARVLQGPGAATPRRGLLRRFGEAIPVPARRALTKAVPSVLRDRLMTRWTTGGIDWSRTPAFTLRADLNGYVRINLRGREAQGIVPQHEYDALCDRIATGLAAFRDAESGDPLIEGIDRSPDVFPAAERSDRLPDLIVRWRPMSGAVHARIVAPELGAIDRATPGRIPNGRSGNHRGTGFLIARGAGIAAGGRLRAGAHVLDLAPTVVRLLGTEAQVPLAGSVLPELVAAAPTASR